QDGNMNTSHGQRKSFCSFEQLTVMNALLFIAAVKQSRNDHLCRQAAQLALRPQNSTLLQSLGKVLLAIGLRSSSTTLQQELQQLTESSSLIRSSSDPLREWRVEVKRWQEREQRGYLQRSAGRSIQQIHPKTSGNKG